MVLNRKPELPAAPIPGVPGGWWSHLLSSRCAAFLPNLRCWVAEHLAAQEASAFYDLVGLWGDGWAQLSQISLLAWSWSVEQLHLVTLWMWPSWRYKANSYKALHILAYFIKLLLGIILYNDLTLMYGLSFTHCVDSSLSFHINHRSSESHALDFIYTCVTWTLNAWVFQRKDVICK